MKSRIQELVHEKKRPDTPTVVSKIHPPWRMDFRDYDGDFPFCMEISILNSTSARDLVGPPRRWPRASGSIILGAGHRLDRSIMTQRRPDNRAPLRHYFYIPRPRSHINLYIE